MRLTSFKNSSKCGEEKFFNGNNQHRHRKKKKKKKSPTSTSASMKGSAFCLKSLSRAIIFNTAEKQNIISVARKLRNIFSNTA